jgi:hypothetical protein
MINDSFQIVEDKTHKNMFTIKFYTPNKALINSLIKTNTINGAIISNDYKTIRFKSDSVKQYETYIKIKKNININNSVRLLVSLTEQLNYLITQESYTFLGYNLKDLIVIDETKFVFLGSELLKEINNNMVFISSPFSPNDFFVSPELLEIKEIPSCVHYKASYFSLAILLLFGFTSNEEIYNEYFCKYKETCEIKEPIVILNKYLQSLPIKNTKLFWLLSRCLVEDPKERNILYI